MAAEPPAGGASEARALWFTAPRTAELRSEAVPPPRPGEVRVRTVASAPSQDTELLVYRGEVAADLPLDLPTLAGGFAFPIKYGSRPRAERLPRWDDTVSCFQRALEGAIAQRPERPEDPVEGTEHVGEAIYHTAGDTWSTQGSLGKGQVCE